MRAPGSTLGYDLPYWLPNLFLFTEPLNLSPSYRLIMLCCLQTEESDGKMTGLKPSSVRQGRQNRQHSAWRSKKRAAPFVVAAQKSPCVVLFCLPVPLKHDPLLTIPFFFIASSLDFTVVPYLTFVPLYPLPLFSFLYFIIS